MDCTIENCGKPAASRGWCRLHYVRWQRTGDPEKVKHRVIRGTVEERFWPKVDRRGPDDCWEWNARRGRRGYGQFVVDRGGERWKTEPAHRIAWELIHGPIPEGLFVCHHCDNPPCCNPAHLFLGSPKDNSADRDRKGRGIPWDTPPARRSRGERHPRARLTETDVRAIRSEYAAGGISQQALADRFGIAQTAISHVVRRTTWAHID